MVYTIIKKADHEFIVRSEEQDVLKCTSRREAARTIADANDLMRTQTSRGASGRNVRPKSERLHPPSADKAAMI